MRRLRFITGCVVTCDVSIRRRYQVAIILPLKALRNKLGLVDKVHYHNERRVLEPRILGGSLATLPRLG